MKQQDFNISIYRPKNKLNPKLFKDDGMMDSKVRLQLLDIADDFVKTLEIKWVKPTNITVVGSSVNYNWNNYSDIDLHIHYDFSKIYNKTEFVKDYFMSKRNEWNKLHDNLTINGIKVEITVVDKDDTAVSNGVYDLEKNKWVKEPQDMNDPKWSEDYIKTYCAKKIEKIDGLCGKIDSESDSKKLEKLEQQLTDIGDDLIQLRKDGLKTKQKELSTGNIIVKVLRNCNYINKLWKYVNLAYDKRMSIKESNNMKRVIERLKIHYPDKNTEELEKILSENFITQGFFDTYVHKSAEEPQSEYERSKNKILKISPEQVNELRNYLKK